MNEFYIGLAFGMMIIALITLPFLLYFGMIWHNIRRMEKLATAQMNKEIPIPEDPETMELIQKAEEILAKSTIQT